MGDIHADQEASWTNSEASIYLSEDEELRGVDQNEGEKKNIYVFHFDDPIVQSYILKENLWICKNCGRIMHTYPSCRVDNLDIERELNSQLDNIRHRFGYNIRMDVQEVHFVNEMCAFLQ
ncbi:hypothetical protein Goari_019722, partial [Gossypium aridum]|nr:hypothetical protein [Gossypium aridum]